ncbi:MAG: TIGR01244 family sulfur transferase [Mesorhizobium sp.]
MDYRQIAENYAVSPQIKLEDIPTIKAAGFKSVICNRPDNEDPGQLDHETIRKAVEEAGLAFKWVPVISGQMTADNVADQAAALEELPGPVFAYCRSGTRCTNLYAGVQQLKA